MDKKDIKIQQKELREILNQWDVLGVASEVDDEYDDIRDTLISKLNNRSSSVDIKKIIEDEIHGSYGLEPNPRRNDDIDKYSNIIFEWYKKYL